jgi:hypothetical protein
MCTLVILIISAGLGIAAGFLHPLLGLVVGVFVFFCGLPEALKCDWIHAEFDHLGSRIESSIKNSPSVADLMAECDRHETYNDNRQLHIHYGESGSSLRRVN